MKALNAAELVSLCEWLKERLVGAQLQDLWTDGESLVLQFYRLAELFVVISLHPSAPVLWLQRDRPRIKKSPKPVTLFLSSHGRNQVLQDLRVQLDKGRCLLWTLSSRDETCEVELDLIPRSPNLVVRAGGKQIWWNKPKDLPPPVLPEMTEVIRDWEAWCLELQLGGGGPQKNTAGVAPSLSSVERTIQKKEKALATLAEQLESPEADRYRQLGEQLKTTLQVPPEFDDLYDSKLSHSENLERAFHKAKEIERKKQGTQNRRLILQGEVEKLRQNLAKGEAPTQPQPTAAGRAMKKGEAHGRKLQLEGGFEAVIGKSGGDNLAILRQARAWDYWLHLKDEPGAHAILFRNRNQEVPPQVIQKVAEWVWYESKGKKNPLPGVKYEVLVVECRFVKPIKGDRLGRVNYTNPRVYTFASKGTS